MKNTFSFGDNDSGLIAKPAERRLFGSLLRRTIRAIEVLSVVGLLSASARSAETSPNILVIYMDDMGYGQLGCYGGTLAPTPHLDALAVSGIRFTDGYVSSAICSPSRVGLMTGRYQAHSGHDGLSTERPGTGLVLTETTMAQRLKAVGYTTAIVGKWHLGVNSPEYMPTSRGFDFGVGSTGNNEEGGGRLGYYLQDKLVDTLPGAPITSPFYAQEASRFIDEHQQGEPWFLYLALNAVHTPIVASKPYLNKFANLSKKQQPYAAMINEADDAVGVVLKKIHDLNLDDNTLIFFMSDNGGAYVEAEMGGLRGQKWLLWEGGVRVPWIASWKGRIAPGQVSKVPVIQLDVLPTVLAAGGHPVDPKWKLDGVNLLPLLESKDDHLDPRELYFRFGPQFAVRQGNWKLVKSAIEMTPMLVNLTSDVGEKNDLTSQNPEKAQTLQTLFDAWNSTMIPPRWNDARLNGGKALADIRNARKTKRKQNNSKKSLDPAN